MRICPKCGHEGMPNSAAFCPMCGEATDEKPSANASAQSSSDSDPHEAKTEVISQKEITSRMDEIRERMQQMRGGGQSVTADRKPVKPAPKKKPQKKGFSETLWFMQVQDPEHMVVDSNTDIEQSDLQDKYTKKQTLEINVRKEFSLNVDLDDFDDEPPKPELEP